MVLASPAAGFVSSAPETPVACTRLGWLVVESRPIQSGFGDRGMIRISRLTDYGIVLLSHMAAHPDRVAQRRRAGGRGAPAAAHREQDPAAARQGGAAGVAPRRQRRLRPGAARRARSPSAASSPPSRGRSPSPRAPPTSPRRLRARAALPGARPLAADQPGGPPGARQRHAGRHGLASAPHPVAHRRPRAGALRAQRGLIRSRRRASQ